MDDLEVLKAVRALLTDPAHWTQGAYARSGPVPEGVKPAEYITNSVYDLQGATCFCLNGAVAKVLGKPNTLSINHTLMDHALSGCTPEKMVIGGVGKYSIRYDDESISSVSFNDNSTHAEVLAALDCAIAKRVQA